MSLFFSILGHITNKKRQSASTLLEGLVAAWDMNEPSGTTMVDSHTNGLDGTINGATPTGSEYSFDGVNDYVSVPDNDLLSFTDNRMSIELWVYCDDLIGDKRLLRKTSEYEIYRSTSTLYIRTYENGTSTYDDWYKTGVFTSGNWTQIVLTLDGDSSASSFQIYANGSLLTKTQGGIPALMANTTNPLIIGSTGSVQYFNGDISKVWVWNRPLLADEVTDLYNAGTPLTYAQLDSGSATNPSEQTFLTSADYYVSSSTGNDTNDGLTQETAWASLSKVNTSSFTAGDVVAFKASDSFEGTLTPPSSGASGNPITFSAYGTGLKPKIYGSELITGWTLHSGNVYKATIGSDINQLFLDGERIQLARIPKTGYYDVTGVTSTTQFTSTQISGAINHVGAKAVIRTNQWGMATKDVTASSSQTLTINSAPQYTITIGDGFFLNNKLDYLTEAGEYYYDYATNTVYLWTPIGDTPANYEVRGSVTDNLVYINNKDYVSIENLELTHSSGVAINTDYCDYLTISNVDVKYPDSKGIYINHDTYGNYTNMTIDGANHIGFHAQFTSYSNIIDNTITNIALFNNLGLTGMGGEQDGRAISNSAGTDITFRYNRIENCGYGGLSWRSPNAIIDKNFIKNVCMVKDDGGAIYSWSSDPTLVIADGSQVTNNIVINSRGNTDGTVSSYTNGSGIYLDNNIQNVLVQDNTVQTSDGCMILNNGCGGNTITGNTFMDGSYQLVTGTLDSPCTITNNIFYTADRTCSYIWWTDGAQRLIRINQSTSTLDYNRYVSHYSTSDLFSDGIEKNLSWEAWKTYIGGEANSTLDTTSLGVGEVEELFYNDTKVNKAFDLTGSYRDLDGVAVSSPLILEPFTSKILIKE